MGVERGSTFIWVTKVASVVLLNLLKFLFFTYRFLADKEADVVSLSDTSMQDSLASLPSKFLNGDLQARFFEDFLDECAELVRLEASFSVF